MKNIIVTCILIVSMIVATITPALADDQTAKSVAESVAVAENLQSGYEASVISRMIGRAGAATATGAKGIAFEIMLKDLENLKSIIGANPPLQLSSSSIDPVADLVGVNASGEAVRMIQCKNGLSDSFIYDTFKRIQGNQYAEAELYMTTEAAEKYNAYAAARSAEQIAVDSGIGCSATEQIAGKALRNSATILKSSFKAGGYAAAITGLVSLAESIINGEDFETALSNTTVDAGISGISCTLAAVSTAEMGTILANLGASALMTGASTCVFGVLVACGSGYVLYILADDLNAKETIASAATALGAKACEIADNCVEFIDGLDLPGKFQQAKSVLTDAGKNVVECVNNISSSVTNSAFVKWLSGLVTN